MRVDMVAPKPATRRVRVVIEGDARPLAHTPRLLVVDYGGRTALVDSEAASVVVEDVQSERTWTDGDVIVRGSHVWAREHGRWARTGDPENTFSDVIADRTLRTWDDAEVLRYQAGDQ